MPGGFPIGLELCNAIDYGTSLTNGGVAITAGHNTPGSYAQLTASTTADAVWMEVSIFPAQGTATNMAVDLAVGSSGNEFVFANKLMANDSTSKGMVSFFSFPVSIPAGTRVSARASANAADTLWVNIRLFDGSFTQMEGSAGVDAIGFSATATTGTTLTSGAASTKGSYAQLTASTPRDYMGFFGVLDTPSVTDFLLLDVAIGGSGSEVIIKPNFGMAMVSSLITANIPTQFTQIPAGTRVAARLASCNNAAATVNLTLYGLYG